MDAQGTMYIGTSKGIIYVHDPKFESIEKLGHTQFHQSGAISALKLFENQKFFTRWT